ncbi:CDP-glucose 4,6-dehydratase [Candidatus Contubernalis alkaliaceticus]|uniref:CDP-glucose 4,6-dehydratase n=1 Tax=Candidatus Contubernalis alkaliaceticus TaxID=338645 RepID=UPI001F4C4D75|nr:CDP-glucose 4,6-dehydratase [Candidatus Contubernalis alkalaceticus]UNC93635.1 CDP-glucose 4,6-dehydratase [Candidatus Contubernalis alkalaceticus]
MGALALKEGLSLFRDKRVLVTGHTGFKGSWLSLWLHMLGAEVTGYALPPEREQDHFNLLGLDNIIHSVEGDIRDLSCFINTVEEFQPEFLFHLAAQPLVRLSYEEPKLTFDTNIAGSVNILEACRQVPSIRTLIYVTSDKCYKNQEWIWGYRENDELGGHDPYSASKAAAEIVFQSYLACFFNTNDRLGAASVRSGNVIGGGDWAQDRIVPDCIRALQEKQPVVLRNPGSTRPWQHVLEPLGGYLFLATRLHENSKGYAGSWNFGPQAESLRSVSDLAERILKCWGEGKIQVQAQQGAPHEAGLLQLNCDKARQEMGWSPRWDFDRTVERTALWYKEVGQGQPALTITRGQIQEYMKELESNHD